jgi:DNA-directed RNA polymerase specialized sigma24 family protein
VQADAIERVRQSGKPPENVAEAKTIVRPIAHARAVDEIRRRNRGGTSNAGLTGDADEHAARSSRKNDPVDEKRMLGIVSEHLTPEELETFDAVAAKRKGAQSERAKELGISEAAMRKRVQKARGTLFERMREDGLASLLPRRAGRAALVGALVTLGLVFFFRAILDLPGQGPRVAKPPPATSGSAGEEKRREPRVWLSPDEHAIVDGRVQRRTRGTWRRGGRSAGRRTSSARSSIRTARGTTRSRRPASVRGR